MISAPGRASLSASSGASRSQTMTSAARMASRPATVSRPGSPGPPPTRITRPIPGSDGSGMQVVRIVGRLCSSASAETAASPSSVPVAATTSAARATSVSSCSRCSQSTSPRSARSCSGGRDRRGDHRDHGAARAQPGDHRQRRGMAAADQHPPAGDVRVPRSSGVLADHRQRLEQRAAGLGIAYGDADPVRPQPGEGLPAPDREALLAQRQAQPPGGPVLRPSRRCRPTRTGPPGQRRPSRPRSARPWTRTSRCSLDLVRGVLRELATRRRSRQAVMTARAGVDTDQGGCCRRRSAISSASPTT